MLKITLYRADSACVFLKKVHNIFKWCNNKRKSLQNRGKSLNLVRNYIFLMYISQGLRNSKFVINNLLII